METTNVTNRRVSSEKNVRHCSRIDMQIGFILSKCTLDGWGKRTCHWNDSWRTGKFPL